MKVPTPPSYLEKDRGFLQPAPSDDKRQNGKMMLYDW